MPGLSGDRTVHSEKSLILTGIQTVRPDFGRRTEKEDGKRVDGEVGKELE